jgi:hypothetical protein
LTTKCPNPYCADPRTAHHWDTAAEHGTYCPVCGYEERHRHHNPEKWRNHNSGLRVMSGGKAKKRKKRKVA